MPGMNSGVNVNDPVVVAAFRAALIHQGLIALLIFTALGCVWIAVRAWPPANTGPAGAPGAGSPGASHPGAPGVPAASRAEPAWRQVLRTGFGLLWVFDGMLQAQPKMALGLPSQVIQPTAASSPRWVQHLVNWAGTTWSYHPMQAGAAAVWIQIGIGVWLLASPRGAASRLAGLAGVAWGLIVWVFGESFGGIFAPGLTWLFGAPGAAAIYVVAGALIALPDRAWGSPRIGRLTLAGLGVFLAGMAVLQAWPGRGFWQGTGHGAAGTLTGMVRSMAGTPQPHPVAGLVSAFASFTAAHGFGVNLAVVVLLAVLGAAFLTGRSRLVRPALIVFAAFCLADWVLVEDTGLFGGLGTDPNSMIPFVLLAVAGYLALARAPAAATEPAAAAAPAVTLPAGRAPAGRPAAGSAAAGSPARWRDRLGPASLRATVATAGFQSVVSAGAIGLIVLGAAPMAAAQANPVADPILAQSINGSSGSVSYPAPPFRLTDQHGRTVTVSSLRGKVVLLTFLDDTCTTDCPLIAQEFRLAGQLLAADTSRVALVAINYNPLYTQPGYIRAFDRQEGLAGVPNWHFLTGSRAQLETVWRLYGVLPGQVLPAGSMIGHGDYAFVLDQAGRMRQELGFDTGPGTTATRSSFAAELTDAARQLLGQS